MRQELVRTWSRTALFLYKWAVLVPLAVLYWLPCETVYALGRLAERVEDWIIGQLDEVDILLERA